MSRRGMACSGPMGFVRQANPLAAASTKARANSGPLLRAQNGEVRRHANGGVELPEIVQHRVDGTAVTAVTRAPLLEPAEWDRPVTRQHYEVALLPGRLPEEKPVEKPPTPTPVPARESGAVSGSQQPVDRIMGDRRCGHGRLQNAADRFAPILSMLFRENPDAGVQ